MFSLALQSHGAAAQPVLPALGSSCPPGSPAASLCNFATLPNPDEADDLESYMFLCFNTAVLTPCLRARGAASALALLRPVQKYPQHLPRLAAFLSCLPPLTPQRRQMQHAGCISPSYIQL